MCGAIPLLLSTPSWLGSQLKFQYPDDSFLIELDLNIEMKLRLLCIPDQRDLAEGNDWFLSASVLKYVECGLVCFAGHRTRSTCSSG
jgi:hypothetical protein